MDPLLTWVRTNSSVVATLSTLVIAIAALIIAIAALANAYLIRLEKRAQKTARMPVLALTQEIEQHETVFSRALYVKNIGYGPALNIVRKIAETQLVVGSLGPGDKTFALFRSNREIPMLDSPAFRAILECDDILDRHWEFTYENRKLSAPRRLSKRKMPTSEANRS